MNVDPVLLSGGDDVSIGVVLPDGCGNHLFLWGYFEHGPAHCHLIGLWRGGCGSADCRDGNW